jgi:hypothetical protein
MFSHGRHHDLAQPGIKSRHGMVQTEIDADGFSDPTGSWMHTRTSVPETVKFCPVFIASRWFQWLVYVQIV